MLVFVLVIFMIVFIPYLFAYQKIKEYSQKLIIGKVLKKALSGKALSEKEIVRTASLIEWVAVILLIICEVILFILITVVIMLLCYVLFRIFKDESMLQALQFLFEDDTKKYTSLSLFFIISVFLVHAYLRLLVFVVKDLVGRSRSVDLKFFSILPFSSAKALVVYLIEVSFLFLLTDLIFAFVFFTYDQYMFTMYKTKCVAAEVCNANTVIFASDLPLNEYPAYLWYALGLHFQFPGTPDIEAGFVIHFLVACHGLINKAVEVLLIGLLANSFIQNFSKKG